MFTFIENNHPVGLYVIPLILEYFTVEQSLLRILAFKITVQLIHEFNKKITNSGPF